MLRLPAALLLTLACCSNAEPDPGVTPIANLNSGATCPETSELSYESFGQAFMQSYCLRCHTAAISGSARRAPPSVNFDDLASIRAAAHMIDQQAGVGPASQREIMPPDEPRPTLDQRMQLSEWLACGAP
jgi:uncharacterized membrane protein